MLILGYWRNQLNSKNSWLQATNFNGRRKLESLEVSRSTLSAELIEFKAFHSIWESYLSQITSSHPSILVVSDLFRWTNNLNATYPLSSEPTMKRKGKCDIVFKQLLGFVSCFITNNSVAWEYFIAFCTTKAQYVRPFF